MSTRLALRIQENISDLTKSQKKLANLILTKPQLIETHSATELANLASVSKATTARFFRSLGYVDFDEVKLQAREERNKTDPYHYKTNDSEKPLIGHQISDHLELEIHNLVRTFEEMNPDRIKEAANLIQNASKLWALGINENQWIARYSCNVFSRLRHNVHIMGGVDKALAEELAMLSPKDCLIVIAFGNEKDRLKAILSYANTTRAKIIILSDYQNLARARRYASIVLPVHITNYGYIPTYTTCISMIRLLAITFMSLDIDISSEHIRLIEEIDLELNL